MHQMIEGLFQLKGKTAVVTGAGRGIGQAVAELFAAAGAQAVVADILPDEAAATAARIRKGGGDALAVTVDIADETAVKQLYRQAVQGPLHHWPMFGRGRRFPDQLKTPIHRVPH